jgi:CRISPR-associated endonuclease/helicase Cas3
LEALPLPVGAVRAWLAGQKSAADWGDVEGQRLQMARTGAGQARPCLRWLGPEDSVVATPADIRPGDTVVVPAEYGGADEFGWKPEQPTPVPDVGDVCSWLARSRPVLRLHRDVMASWQPQAERGEAMLSRTVAALLAGEEEESAPLVSAALAAVRDWPGAPRWAAGAAEQLLRQRFRALPYPRPSGRSGWTVSAVRRVRPPGSFPVPVGTGQAAPEGELAPESDSVSLLGREVSLDEHCRGVEEKARALAEAIGLPSELQEVVATAARFHDLGKADPRFQAWLHGGDRLAADAATGLLAKSGMDSGDRAGWRWARAAAGYPAGTRHECLSVALLLESAALKYLSPADRELALFLVGTHHGHGRAFFPVVPDGTATREDISPFRHAGVEFKRGNCDHGQARLAAGWTDRFWWVVRRHGYWGSALLEAVVQLADHLQSANEQQNVG